MLGPLTASFASPETTLPDEAAWKPSEIPSETQSVSVFLHGLVSVGPRFSDEVTGSQWTQHPGEEKG